MARSDAGSKGWPFRHRPDGTVPKSDLNQCVCLPIWLDEYRFSRQGKRLECAGRQEVVLLKNVDVTTNLVREVIVAPLDRSVLAFSHNYPYPFTGWHYHPEYEIHIIRRSTGSYFVGTHAGRFEPGNLVLMGPNLPHMWVSDAACSEREDSLFIENRDMVLQFSEAFSKNCIRDFEGTKAFELLLHQSRSGIEFSHGTSLLVQDLLQRLIDTSGLSRLSLFFEIFSVLAEDEDRRLLGEAMPEIPLEHTERIDAILEYIAENFNSPELTCGLLAEREKMPFSTFSRFFAKSLNCSCQEYINRLRIYKACQLLIETRVPITSISYDVGFDVLSTFNRNFIRYIGVAPRDFRLKRGFDWTIEPGQPLSSSTNR